jgi:hypothetical protein
MDEDNMNNKFTEKIVLFFFILTTIFLLSTNFTLGLANYTIDTLNYDDTSSDLISTNFYNTYQPFIFNGTSYRSESELLGDTGLSATVWDLDRINLYDKEVVGVNANITYDSNSVFNNAKICIGDGNTSFTASELQFDNGYCLATGTLGTYIYPYIAQVRQSSIYSTSQLSANTLINIQFYIDNGQIIFVLDDVVYANITDASYTPDIYTTYMFTSRHYNNVYDSYINVSTIKDMVKHDCFPNWTINNSECYGNKYYKGYTDLNDCGKPLPIDNGTFIDYCELDNYYINECGTFNINNSVAHINITTFSNPCMIFNVENSSIDCIIELNDTYSNVFAYIEHINNVSIHDCSINNFVQGFLMPENYLQGNNNDNNFYNINFDGLDSSAFGFDVRQGYGQSLNHTSIQNIIINNAYNNGGINMYGDGINDILLENIDMTNTYTGMWLGLISNLYINNFVTNGGTIYGLYLYADDNAIVENSRIINYAVQSLLLQSSHDVFFSNVENEVNNLVVDTHFISGDSNFTEDSNNNIGWFPTQNILYNDDVNLLSLYLGENKGFNVIGGNLVLNKSIEYFLIPECEPLWTKYPMPCIDGVAIINYKDYNDCDKMSEIPLDNATNEYCSISTINTNVSEPYVIPFIILFIFLIITVIIGLAFYPLALIVSALITAFIGSLAIYYKLDNIVAIICYIMCIILILMSVFIHKMKKN